MVIAEAAAKAIVSNLRFAIGKTKLIGFLKNFRQN